MVYEVTATKKRPKDFDELVGQEFVTTTIRSSIKRSRIAHAFLFSGPRGVGKTSAARILAKALNCEQGLTDKPCGVCISCKAITHGNCLDVIEIDGASNTGVNDVRAIKDEILFAPNSSRYKIYIIDEVHMLSNSAFNALLKTIEEPPPYIVFIFATTEVHKVPATIRSRCQQFNFHLISIQQIKEKLKEVVDEMKLQAEDQALFWLAKESTGSLRDAYTLLDQVISFSDDQITLKRIQEKLGIVGIEQINKIGELIIDGDKRHILDYTSDILDKGISVEQFVIELVEYFRNLLFVKSGINKESLLSCSPDNFSKDVIEFFSTAQLEKAIEMFLELYRNLKFSLNQRFELELLMSRLAELKKLIIPSELIGEVQKLKADILLRGNRPAIDQGREIKPEQAHEGTQISDKQDLLKRLIETIKRGKPALASSLEKIDSSSLSEDLLSLSFQARDRFSGEHVLKEKETVSKQVAQILKRPVKVEIDILESDIQSKQVINEKVEIVKKVFRGEIIKGE